MFDNLIDPMVIFNVGRLMGLLEAFAGEDLVDQQFEMIWSVFDLLPENIQLLIMATVLMSSKENDV